MLSGSDFSVSERVGDEDSITIISMGSELINFPPILIGNEGIIRLPILFGIRVQDRVLN
ncbi:MAG: hypothetical protein ACJZ02_03580 [Candidatus Neomarinimicrobiota bacterium]